MSNDVSMANDTPSVAFEAPAKQKERHKHKKRKHSHDPAAVEDSQAPKKHKSKHSDKSLDTDGTQNVRKAKHRKHKSKHGDQASADLIPSESAGKFDSGPVEKSPKPAPPADDAREITNASNDADSPKASRKHKKHKKHRSKHGENLDDADHSLIPTEHNTISVDDHVDDHVNDAKISEEARAVAEKQDDVDPSQPSEKRKRHKKRKSKHRDVEINGEISKPEGEKHEATSVPTYTAPVQVSVDDLESSVAPKDAQLPKPDQSTDLPDPSDIQPSESSKKRKRHKKHKDRHKNDPEVTSHAGETADSGPPEPAVEKISSAVQSNVDVIDSSSSKAQVGDSEVISAENLTKSSEKQDHHEKSRKREKHRHREKHEKEDKLEENENHEKQEGQEEQGEQEKREKHKKRKRKHRESNEDSHMPSTHPVEVNPSESSQQQAEPTERTNPQDSSKPAKRRKKRKHSGVNEVIDGPEQKPNSETATQDPSEPLVKAQRSAENQLEADHLQSSQIIDVESHVVADGDSTQPSKKHKKHKKSKTHQHVESSEPSQMDNVIDVDSYQTPKSKNKVIDVDSYQVSKSKNKTIDVDKYEAFKKLKSKRSGTEVPAKTSKEVSLEVMKNLKTTKDLSKSPFVIQTHAFYLPMSPIAQKYTLQGVCGGHFSKLLMTYSYDLDGIVLCYRNPRLLDKPPTESNSKVIGSNRALAKSIDEYAAPFVWASADFVLLRPARGKELEGSITAQSETHLSLIVLNVFSVSVEKKRLPSGWKWSGAEDGAITGKRRKKAKGKKAKGNDQNQSAETDKDGDVVMLPSVTDATYTTFGQGYWTDAEGNRVQGKIPFRIKDFEVTHADGTEGSILTFEGTMLDDDAERKLLAHEVRSGNEKSVRKEKARLSKETAIVV